MRAPNTRTRCTMCYNVRFMSKRIRQITQALVFTVLITVGIGLVSRWDFSLLPLPEESTHLLRAAVETEYISLAQWPEGVVADPSPFHQAAGLCARFFGEGKQQLPIRCYRVFPSVLSILFLLALPALGLRRRGGVFDSADGPLWALAFAIASPTWVWNGVLFTPFSFQLFCFLAFLLAARSYAQWPGFASAIAAGAALAVSIALDPDTVWAIGVLIPAVAVGVGWRRLRLYWRTTHILAAFAVSGALAMVFVFLDVARAPALPVLPTPSAEWAMETLQRLLWFSAGGLGVLAWISLAILGGFRPDRRWIRLLTILFPCCVVLACFFTDGVIFPVMLTVLTPIMIGVMLSEVPIAWLRGVQGIILWSGLVGWTYLVYTDMEKELLTREEARDTITALAAAQELPRVNACRMRICSPERETAARFIWPVRHLVGSVECGGVYMGGEADMHLVAESAVSRVPLDMLKTVRRDELKLDRSASYILFTAQEKQDPTP